MKKLFAIALSFIFLTPAAVFAEESTIKLTPEQVQSAVKNVTIDGSGIVKEVEGLEHANNTMQNQLNIKPGKIRIPISFEMSMPKLFLNRFQIR